MRTLFFVFLTCALQAQSWTFTQGYILEDSTVTVMNRSITATIAPNMVLLNTLELMYDRYEKKDGVLIFYLSSGGLMYYTETEPHGPGITIIYANVRISAWTIFQESFQIDLK